MPCWIKKDQNGKIVGVQTNNPNGFPGWIEDQRTFDEVSQIMEDQS